MKIKGVEERPNTDFNPHARMRDLGAQFEDEPTTFKDWEAFIILNYPSYYNDKSIMRMLKELYELDRK